MKKSIRLFAFGLLLFVFSYKNCFALSEICEVSSTLKAFKIVGVLILIIKILAPLAIILTGITSMVKAVIADDESEIKKCVSVLVSKVIVGVIIFSVPSIVYAVFDLVEKSKTTRSEFVHCSICLVNLKVCNQFISTAESNEGIGSDDLHHRGSGGTSR